MLQGAAEIAEDKVAVVAISILLAAAESWQESNPPYFYTLAELEAVKRSATSVSL